VLESFNCHKFLKIHLVNRAELRECLIVIIVNTYAILAHHKPQSLLLLLETLKDKKVFLHIDKGADRKQFLLSIDQNHFPYLNILPKNRSVKVNWGGYSVVKAEFELIKYIVDKEPSFKKIVFLSGEDYPIRPIMEFEEYLSSRENIVALQQIKPDMSKGPDFIENLRFSRIGKIHNLDLIILKGYKKRNFLSTKIFHSPHKILKRLNIPNRKIQPTSRYFVGSQWIAISSAFAKVLLTKEVSIQKEFRYSFAPDELAFQTIFGRIKDQTSENPPGYDAVIDASFHVVPPSFTVGGSEWKLSDLDAILDSKKFFVRKPSQDLLNQLRRRNV